MELPLEQLRALATIVDTGSFETAAARLGVTPSAVSQRIRALESSLGAVVLRRSRPVEVTEAGERVLRTARQITTLHAELVADVDATARRPRLRVVVNSDSLGTWALPALAAAAQHAEIEVIRADESRSAEALRSGRAMAAITSDPVPAPGGTSRRLGIMRYHASAAPGTADRWFAAGLDAATLSHAPLVCFDEADGLQEHVLRAHGVDPATPPRHDIPATADYLDAIALGMGWGMLPELQTAQAEERGRIVRLPGAEPVDVPLYWQQWRLRSGALDRLASEVAAAASATLR